MTPDAKPKKRRKPVYAYVRVQPDGSLRCADEFSRNLIRKLKPEVGELVRVSFHKRREYGQWLKAHKLGQLIIENLDDFSGFVDDKGKPNAHGALKKLQQLSGVECDVTDIEIPGLGTFSAKQPRSLSFDEMDEMQFQAAYSGFCGYLRKTYWPTLEDWQIEEMAGLVGMAA